MTWFNKNVEKPYNAADARHVDFPKFGGRDAPRGSTTVPLGRELVSSNRLSIQTTFVSGIPFGRNLRCKF